MDCNDDIGKLTRKATAGNPEDDNAVAHQLSLMDFSQATISSWKMAQRKECFADGTELEFNSRYQGPKTSLKRYNLDPKPDQPDTEWIFEQELELWDSQPHRRAYGPHVTPINEAVDY